MKYINNLWERECIHCKTEEEANAICKMMHNLWRTWRDWDSYLRSNMYYRYTDKTCYDPKWWHADLKFFLEEGWTVHNAKDFIPDWDRIPKCWEKVNAFNDVNYISELIYIWTLNWNHICVSKWQEEGFNLLLEHKCTVYQHVSKIWEIKEYTITATEKQMEHIKDYLSSNTTK